MMMMIIIIMIIIIMIVMMFINDDDDDDDKIIIIITTTTIIIIITFKGAIKDFQQSPHCAENRLQHVRSNGSGAIVCKSRATRALITCNMSCYVPRGTKGQLSY